jgi:hypothetical protein
MYLLLVEGTLQQMKLCQINNLLVQWDYLTKEALITMEIVKEVKDQTRRLVDSLTTTPMSFGEWSRTSQVRMD